MSLMVDRQIAIEALRCLNARPDLLARFVDDIDSLECWNEFVDLESFVSDFAQFVKLLGPINPLLLAIGMRGAQRMSQIIEASTMIAGGRCIGAGAAVVETITCDWCGRTDELQLPPYYHEIEDSRDQDAEWWSAVDDADYQDVRGSVVCGPCAGEDPQVIAEGRVDLALAAWKDGEL